MVASATAENYTKSSEEDPVGVTQTLSAGESNPVVGSESLSAGKVEAFDQLARRPGGGPGSSNPNCATWCSASRCSNWCDFYLAPGEPETLRCGDWFYNYGNASHDYLAVSGDYVCHVDDRKRLGDVLFEFLVSDTYARTCNPDDVVHRVREVTDTTCNLNQVWGWTNACEEKIRQKFEMLAQWDPPIGAHPNAPGSGVMTDLCP